MIWYSVSGVYDLQLIQGTYVQRGTVSVVCMIGSYTLYLLHKESRKWYGIL
jgi:hypothetical protein